jgi:hypothetical protein
MRPEELAGGWREVSSKEGGFSVSMPGDPEVSLYGGEVLMNLQAHGAAFLVATLNQPPFEDDALAKLDRARKESLQQATAAHMTLMAERHVSLPEVQGLELQLEDSLGVKHVTRFYFNRACDPLVMVAVRGLPAFPEDVATRFLESFRFRPGVEPPSLR